MSARRAILLLTLGLATASAVAGHGLDPASLLLREIRPGIFEVTWRTAGLRLPGTDVRPVLPSRCRAVSAAADEAAEDHVTLRWTVDCGPGGLAGETLRIDDLAAAKINGLISLTFLDGADVQAVLGPRRATFDVPPRATRLDVVRSYIALGIEHILTGPDHLLFVFGLLLLVRTRRLLVQTITAFTLGHSLTLSAAVLRLAAVPSRPVEVLIALSVLVLAVELARERDTTVLRRFPWAMAVAFGLLHGFGFAGALAEAGLPAGDVPLALLAFNVGIEVGQLAFVGAALLAGAVVTRRLPTLARRGHGPAVYAMGILAAFWCLERIAAWLA